MSNKSTLYLPALSGQFSNWRYFQAVISVRELTEVLKKVDGNNIYRIRTVSEVEEIYSQKGINFMLQRLFDKKRLKPLKNYLLNQKDRYINNMTIALYGGDPQWLPINVSLSSFLDLDIRKDESYWEEFGKCFGVIKLNGDEVLFVLDGQHRLMALREAVLEDKKILSQNISITLITHEVSEKGRKKTRRLFTTINRYAKPVSLGENILLDEDDLSAIIARQLIEEYKYFKGNNLIALNKTANLNLQTDREKFSTVIELWNINEILIPHKSVYPVFSGSKNNLVRIRPEDKIINHYRNEVFNFWDFFFSAFPKSKEFVKMPDKNIRNNGGPFSLRPISQTIIGELYFLALCLKRLKKFERDVRKIPDDLLNQFWHYVLWDPQNNKMILNKSFAKDYLIYHLGFPITESRLIKLKINYQKNIRSNIAELPDKLIK